VRLASRIERSWLEADFPASVREVIDTRFDPKTEKVRATATRSYRDLPLEEPRERPAPPALAAELLAEAAAPRAEEIFLADDAARVLLARLRFLAEHLPELELVPLGAKELAEVIAGACAGRTSLAELRGADLAGLIEARLTHPARAALAREAPESIRVPSGSHIRLHWEPGKPPVLAARLQELFGWKETPRVARGRVPVLLHILGPNHRPVQVTQDLASFWSTTYAEVRKDLRGRYPKHSWPEDPWSAEPERRPRRKGETKTKAKDPAETEGPRKAGARGKTKRKRPG
jgi:ATP-dependent helicase HrpB